MENEQPLHPNKEDGDDTEQACKRLKTETETKGGAPADAPSEEREAHAPSEEEDSERPAPPPIRANDAITLKFVDRKTPNFAFMTQPEFTHQLFDEEEIKGLEVDASKDLITICTDLQDLGQYVQFSEKLRLQEQDDIFEHHLSKGVPQCAARVPSSCSLQVPERSENFQPIGRLVHTFQCPSTSAGACEEFEIWLATDKDAGASDLLHRAEKLAMWFIETADGVDFSDERWEALFVFQRLNPPGAGAGAGAGGDPDKHRHSTVRVAGYMTLFTFHNPFLGSKLRICQALIMPHLQVSMNIKLKSFFDCSYLRLTVLFYCFESHPV